MACPHRQFSTCDNCLAREMADDRFLRDQNYWASRRDEEREARARKEYERRERSRAGRRAYADRQREIAANTSAAKARKRAARAKQPFGLFWYERIGLVAAAFFVLLAALAELPNWLLLLLLVVVGVAVRRFGSRPFRAVAGVAESFVRGQRALRGTPVSNPQPQPYRPQGEAPGQSRPAPYPSTD